jgi:hypothetical protein
MNEITFARHINFKLLTNGWGIGRPLDIATLLDSVILDFYADLDQPKIATKSVIVANSNIRTPQRNTPEIIKLDDFDTIFLNTQDRLWSQYAYQFAHELCHHVIDSDFFGKLDQFGWLEESFCELASIYTIDKMSTTWLVRPPYQNWRDYAHSLKSYVDEILSKGENRIKKPLSEWLNDNLPELTKDRYKRTENRIVAIHLFNLFKDNPILWQTIQHIKMVKVTEKMDLKEFICLWKSTLPGNLKSKFEPIEEILVGGKLCP